MEMNLTIQRKGSQHDNISIQMTFFYIKFFSLDYLVFQFIYRYIYIAAGKNTY